MEAYFLKNVIVQICFDHNVEPDLSKESYPDVCRKRGSLTQPTFYDINARVPQTFMFVLFCVTPASQA